MAAFSNSFYDSLLYSATKASLNTLLSSGALSPDARNDKNRTPLHVIAANPPGFNGGEKTAKELVKLLIKKGANVNVQDSLGYTPLHLACDSCCISIVRSLLRAKASVWLRTNTGTLPLHILVAGYVKDEKSITNYFVVLDDMMKKMQGGLDAVNNRKDTLLHYLCASKNASEDVLRFILNRDSSFINFLNSEGFSALHNAIRAGRADMARTLLEMGADPTIPSREGTCIHLANMFCKDLLPRLQGGSDFRYSEPLSISSAAQKSREAVGFITEQLGNLSKETRNLGKETMLSLGLSEIRVFDNYKGKKTAKEMEVINASLRTPPPPPTTLPSIPQLQVIQPRGSVALPPRPPPPLPPPPNHKPTPPIPNSLVPQSPFNTSPSHSPHSSPRSSYPSFRSKSEVLPLPHPPQHRPKLGPSASAGGIGLVKTIEPYSNYSSGSDKLVSFDQVSSTSTQSLSSADDSSNYDFLDEDFEIMCLEDVPTSTGRVMQAGKDDDGREENYYRTATTMFRNSILLNRPLVLQQPTSKNSGEVLPFKLLEREVLGQSIHSTHIHQNIVVHGLLYATNYRLVFIPFETQFKELKGRGNYKLSIPLGAMTKFEMIGEVEPPYSWYRIFRRDFNDILMAMSSSDGGALSRFLEPRINCKNYRELFAFQQKSREFQDLGWSIYDPMEDFKRMSLPNGSWKVVDNRLYTYCHTYPKLLIVPSELTQQDLMAIAQYRTKCRLPVLVWYSTVTKSVIIRCSQPGGGMTNSRSKEDEKYFQLLSNYCEEVFIYDARPKLNAYANHLTGGGGENLKYYSGCKRKFLNIGNIHVMRSCFEKLKKALVFQDNNLGMKTNVGAINAWLEQLSLILAGAVDVVTPMLSPSRTASVVHCSDGWDRTSQIVALAELMLDPYYRTIRGFIVLIEKEWLSFGHKFTDRTGPGNISSKVKERAPIFHQFIDCVWQLWIQYQKRFEFNDKFLVTILRHLYSCRFGTFLGDSERERWDVLKTPSMTYSLWTFILSDNSSNNFNNSSFSSGNNNLKSYLNPEYSPYNNEYGSEAISDPKTNKESLQIWSSYYLLSIFNNEDD